MGISGFYGATNDNEAIQTIRSSLDLGCTFLDTAAMYSPWLGINGKPEYVIKSCEVRLSRLDIDHIDPYYLHRVDTTLPIEETIGAIVP